MFKIRIPLEAFEQPGVAEAVSSLMLALGTDGEFDGAVDGPAVVEVLAAGEETVTVVPEVVSAEEVEAEAPAAEPAVAEPVVVEAAVEEAPAVEAAPEAPRPRRGRKPKPKPPEPELPTDPEARYHAAVQLLPERSRQFLALVEEAGTLTIQDAMKGMGITAPKSMGGITGSMGRWLPAKGVKVPYYPLKVDGARAWRWIGINGEIPEPEPEEKKPRRRRRRKPAGPAAPDPAELARKAQAKYDTFFGELPGQSQRFLELLKSRETLLMSEVLEYFGLARAMAVGGYIEPIKRLAKVHEIDLPYEATTSEARGERQWNWIDPVKTPEVEAAIEATTIPSAAEPEAPEPEPTFVRVRRRA